MNVAVDDVGSFPLPPNVDRKTFEKAFVLAREAISKGEDLGKNRLLADFCQIVTESFRLKCSAGLDVVNYPQHYDMHRQFAELIHKAMDSGTYVVTEKDAIIPEVHVISSEAKSLSEELKSPLRLRVCVTGPLELYLREIGKTGFKDVLFMFAETVRRFARNSVLDSKYVRTEVVSLDEPSFGFQEVSVDNDLVVEVFEKAFDFSGAVKQIHLHSPARASDLLKVGNLDVLSFEYAASPKNLGSITKKALEEADKSVRVGVARTDIDAIRAELYEKGVTAPTAEQLVEGEKTIQKRFARVKEIYGERFAFTGPDCGLGGWPTQKSAHLLLKRTVNAVKNTET
ncbi:MAG: hypothetical protein QHH24_02895 [Candidatus Bathyarchaeota archaeon]|nr:hypothetical protein [Candidatus Bathyarchaeota archaeon]